MSLTRWGSARITVSNVEHRGQKERTRIGVRVGQQGLVALHHLTSPDVPYPPLRGPSMVAGYLREGR